MCWGAHVRLSWRADEGLAKNGAVTCILESLSDRNHSNDREDRLGSRDWGNGREAVLGEDQIDGFMVEGLKFGLLYDYPAGFPPVVDHFVVLYSLMSWLVTQDYPFGIFLVRGSMTTLSEARMARRVDQWQGKSCILSFLGAGTTAALPQ